MMRPLTYGSVCSGIEAASVAWEPLGMRPAWFAEVDKAVSAVLAHHFPSVQNLGDMTTIPAMLAVGLVPAPDILVGGTPCQAFSLAGRREGLADARGQLTLTYVDILDEIDRQRAAAGHQPGIAIWENVPGVLSQHDNAFGCFLAALAGDEDALRPGERPEAGKSGTFWTWDKKNQQHRPKWPVAGVVAGPTRTVGWIVRDAQYYGLAQRRRRVFVVASAREGFDPAAILFEFDRVRRDSPPRRETGEGTTHSTAPCLTSSGRGVERTGDTRGQDPVVDDSDDGVLGTRSAGAVDETVGALDTECGFSKATMQSVHAGHVMPCVEPVKTGDPSHHVGDGSPVSQTLDAVLHKGQTMPEKNRFPAVLQPVTGFSSKDYGADASADLAPTLRASGHAETHANGGSPPAVAYAIQERAVAQNPATGPDASEDGTGRGQPITVCHGTQDPCVDHEIAFAVGRNNGGENVVLAAPVTMAVRRLMPVECERLQGFPDNWTRIPVKHYKQVKVTKSRPEHLWERDPEGPGGWLMAADGPRYKQLGNSMPVPVMRWLGSRVLFWVRHGDWIREVLA